MFYTTHCKSPVGNITLASDGNNLVGLWIEGQKYYGNTAPALLVPKDNLPVLQAAVTWLKEYFAGNRPNIAGLPLAPIGGEFRQLVWKLLLEIPYGEVTTYGRLASEVAKRMGKARMSSQAVGGAVGHNPISIIIPCHRVVGTSGSLTGYAGGINKKIALLRHEGADMSNLFVPRKSTAM